MRLLGMVGLILVARSAVLSMTNAVPAGTSTVDLSRHAAGAFSCAAASRMKRGF